MIDFSDANLRKKNVKLKNYKQFLIFVNYESSDMKKLDLMFLILTLLFAVLMSVPFLVPHTGMLALFGFVPLLVMETVAEIRRVRHFWIWHYSAFVLWNAITTFWVCNATIGGGIFAVLANAFQMSLIFGVFRFGKKYLGNILSYIFLAMIWIAWERFYFSAQISWPWLTLGNAFARSTGLVQWYEYTGSLGGSLWVWACNLWAFFILMFLLGDHYRDLRISRRFLMAAGYAVVLFVPVIISRCIYSNYEESADGGLDVVIAQPNFDPYEKFESVSRQEQNRILLDLFDEGLSRLEDSDGRPLLIAPETFTNDIIVGSYDQSPTWNEFQAFLGSHRPADILFGASTFEYFDSRTAPSPNSRHIRDDIWLETHNSALMVNRSGDTELYHKSKLVVGVEMTPFPSFFTKIDDMLGNVMGRCVGQEEVSLLHSGDVPIGSVICYESVFGEYCTQYVKKGARALAIITNDSWWGNTPGYRQHMSYASLRAIETRRDIARCANSGISAIIDQRGDVVSESEWWNREVMVGRLNLNDRETFFVKHGDLVGRICTVAFFAFLLLFFVRLFVRRK